MSEQEKKLYVICEGGIHMVEYLNRNGIYPNTVIIKPDRFREVLPYLNKGVELLVIVNNLITFNMDEIYALLSDIYDLKEEVKITLVSNVNLGRVKIPYYLYRGDLMLSEMVEIEDSKGLNDIRNLRDKFSKNVKEKRINKVMSRYKRYYSKQVEANIRGTISCIGENNTSTDGGKQDPSKDLVFVDIFASQTNK